jgi:DNA-binding HxlR family transcriptional regulator
MPKKAGSALIHRSDCPTSTFLDLMGDKWTMLIMRDMLVKGRTRYNELAASREKIPTNLLADRLVKLEAAGLISKKPYQDKPKRYSYAPTDSGLDLLDVISAMAQWSNAHVPGTAQRPPAVYVKAKKEWKARLKAEGA